MNKYTQNSKIQSFYLQIQLLSGKDQFSNRICSLINSCRYLNRKNNKENYYIGVIHRYFRQELQTAMEMRKKKNSAYYKNDYDYADQIQQSVQRQTDEEYQKIILQKQKEADLVKYSQQQGALKKMNLQKQRDMENQQSLEIYNKDQEILKDEQMGKLMKKNQLIEELNSAYKDMENNKRYEQHKIKLFEKQSMQEEINRQYKEEEQRKNVYNYLILQFLIKIKQNYHQNDQLLQQYNQIYTLKEREQMELENKLVKQAGEEKRKQEEQRLIIEQAIRQKKNKETLNQIVEQIEYKKQSKYQQQQQKSQELEYFGFVNQLYKQKDQEDLKAKVENQKQYRQDLIMQMEEQQTKKKKDQSMSTVEMKLNQNYYNSNSVNVGIVPGIYIDHNRLKQQQYLDGYSQKRGNSSFARKRNLSAYFAGNEITTNATNQNQNISGYY